MTRLLTILLGLGLTIMLAAAGCEERDVSFVVDEDELIRILSETEEGRDLFRTDGLIPTAPYQTVFDNAIWSDSVLSHERTLTVTAPTKEVDYGNLGFLREGVILVNDRFTVETTRQFANSSSVDTNIRDVKRDALFLKLGNDSRPFVGWVMYGYNGIGSSTLPVNVRLQPDSGLLFFGDKTPHTLSARSISLGGPYVPLVDIRDLRDGESLVCSTSVANSLSPLRTFQVLTFAEGSGYAISSMNQVNRQSYLDTIPTPINNPRLWNIIYFQAYNDTTGKLRDSWCVPYRIPQ